MLCREIPTIHPTRTFSPREQILQFNQAEWQESLPDCVRSGASQNASQTVTCLVPNVTQSDPGFNRQALPKQSLYQFSRDSEVLVSYTDCSENCLCRAICRDESDGRYDMLHKVLTFRFSWLAGLAALAMGGMSASAQSGSQAQSGIEESGLTYADLAGMSDASQLVIRAQIRKQITVDPARAAGLAPGFARIYIQAQTLSLLSGRAAIGESLNYLVDVPLDSRGKVPKLKKLEVLLFARAVPGRPGEIQLVGPEAQQLYSPELESRIRPILSALVAPDSPPVITGVRDALSVAGNLAGESETQIFLDTRGGAPVSLTVLRRPGRAAVWGVSWGEIIDQAARPPEPNTLAWYRLACALPQRLPSNANLSRVREERSRAERDYAFVLASLGPCVRNAG